ncbi:hypothetical protein [Legionella septentrionalis]|uniref:hypothetical protein n=1 Tax=Legionella septentrionalis TaxID=2498109 RepID=UPI000F8D4327|nr:hypothetical protein [Legionella septentrionalis]RUR16757.1 hypothetical protein ELY10_02450 [Legionella septentrionalis]
MNVLDELLSLVSSKVHIAKGVLRLVKLETRLAGMSIFPLLVTLVLLFIIVISAWLTLMVILGYGVTYLYDSIMVALSCVFIFNLIVLAILLKYLLFNLKNMSFAKTRKFLATQDGDDDDTKGADFSYRKAGTNLATTTTRSE